MDKEALVNEICRRVEEKLQALGTDRPEETETPQDDRRKLLLLTEKHGTICHDFLENRELSSDFRIECALLADYRCQVEDYEGLVVYTLSVSAMAKLAAGIADDDFTRLFAQALLEGKKIWLVREGIELYTYQETAPPSYYRFLEAKLEFLKKAGITIATHDQLPGLLAGNGTSSHEPEETERRLPGSCCQAAGFGQRVQEDCCKTAGSGQGVQEDCCKTTGSGQGVQEDCRQVAAPEQENRKTAVLAKRIITERDIISLAQEKTERIIVGERAILTDLAKEYAVRNKIEISREQA